MTLSNPWPSLQRLPNVGFVFPGPSLVSLTDATPSKGGHRVGIFKDAVLLQAEGGLVQGRHAVRQEV